MTRVVAGLVAIVLLGFLGIHGSLLGALIMHRPRYRAAVALVLPPLAPYWGWRAGFRTRAYAWATALLLYAVGVGVLTR
jgi:hypothetical protein